MVSTYSPPKRQVFRATGTVSGPKATGMLSLARCVLYSTVQVNSEVNLPKIGDPNIVP